MTDDSEPAVAARSGSARGPGEDSSRSRLRHVVVATDFLGGATRAAARAATLPLTPDGVITLLYVRPVDPVGDAKSEADARRALGTIAAAIVAARQVAGWGSADARCVIRRGKPFVEIIRFAREAGADLVVIGRHQKRAVRDLFLGTTAERVIRKGDLPVLLVNRDPDGPYRRPLVALDLSDTSRRALALSLRLIDAEARTVDVIHANEPSPEPTTSATVKEVVRHRQERRLSARAELHQLLERQGETGVRWKIHLREGDPRRVIQAQVARRHPDLLVLGSHGRSGLAHILIGSVAETLVREVPCDALVARPAEGVFELP